MWSFQLSACAHSRGGSSRRCAATSALSEVAQFEQREAQVWLKLAFRKVVYLPTTLPKKVQPHLSQGTSPVGGMLWLVAACVWWPAGLLSLSMEAVTIRRYVGLLKLRAATAPTSLPLEASGGSQVCVMSHST